MPVNPEITVDCRTIEQLAYTAGDAVGTPLEKGTQACGSRSADGPEAGGRALRHDELGRVSGKGTDVGSRVTGMETEWGMRKGFAEGGGGVRRAPLTPGIGGLGTGLV